MNPTARTRSRGLSIHFEQRPDFRIAWHLGQVPQARRIQPLQKSGGVAISFVASHPTSLGGEATLGYDRERPFVPTAQQQASWVEETQRTGMYPGALDAFLDKVMTPLRRVSMEPFLLEVLATPLAPAPVFDASLGGIGGWRGSMTPITASKTLERISREGFRFPISDEWEYACAAGSRTLFRWGNMTPPVYIPHLGRKIAAGWDLHLRENAFGLLIARDPYHWEFCAEPGLMRGEDGGIALHAGAGTFAAWLTLASAFYQIMDREDFYSVYLRRTCSLL